MKTKKAILLIIILLLIAMVTTACMGKVNEKIGNKIGEKVLEKTLGDDVNIDTKNNELSIETSDGSLQVGKNIKWPTDKMASLPKPKGKVISVTDLGEEDATSVMVEFSNRKDLDNYIESVKELGYIENVISQTGGMFSYTGVKDDNTHIMLGYQDTEDMLIITLSRNSNIAKDYFEKEEELIDFSDVDMTDELPWPNDFMDNIPELAGKIVNVTTSKDFTQIELQYVTREDLLLFIEDLKTLGFSLDTMEIVSPESIIYNAKNNKDHIISIGWDKNEASINYRKP